MGRLLDAVLQENWEYKVVSYADVATFQTGLVTETADGWQPIATTNRAPAIGEEVLIVTYRRRL